VSNLKNLILQNYPPTSLLYDDIDGNNTVDYLKSLLFIGALHKSPKNDTAISALCRKIDIAKQVWVVYDGEWNKPLVKSPISEIVWGALALVMYWKADSIPISTGDQRGNALKYLNSAFSAISHLGPDNIEIATELNLMTEHKLVNLIHS